MHPHHCPNCGCQLKRFEPLVFGNVEIHRKGRIVFEGTALSLPPSQYILLEALIRARGRGLERSTLANMLASDLSDASIPKYIERLRDTFRGIKTDFDQIECLRGFGAYRWVAREINTAGSPQLPRTTEMRQAA